jgi:hypothetical protein
MLEHKLYQNAIPFIGDLAERRAHIEHQNQERAAERQQQIALQSSPLSGPEERIRLWEKLHALNLPRSANHKLLGVIAEQTNLSIQDVLAAQQRRAAPVVASVTVPVAVPVAVAIAAPIPAAIADPITAPLADQPAKPLLSPAVAS